MPESATIACLYGRTCAPFVERVASDLCAAAGRSVTALTLEAALANPNRVAGVRHLYVLPFDVPTAEGPEANPRDLVRRLFPQAALFTSFGVQELCWDKLATQERLLDRGLPVPDTIVTSDPQDVAAFVRAHGFAVLKEKASCAGAGHVVIWLEDGQLLGDSGSHRYAIELASAGEGRRLYGDRFVIPGPFYVQRLVADVDAGRVRPGKVLRAYVVDRQIVFWTERYRERYLRPSDWIVSVARGARYRFVLGVSEEMRKVALRSADAVGLRAGVVDLVRTGRGGPYVLDVDTDGVHMIIDRSFKDVPDYRDFFDFDRYVARALVRELEGPAESAVRTIGDTGRRGPASRS